MKTNPINENSRFGVKLWNEIPCSLRNLPKKEFKREIRRILIDILAKEHDHIETSISVHLV